MCKHYLRRCFCWLFGWYFWVLLSTPSYQTYDTLDNSYHPPKLFLSGEWTVKYILQDPLPKRKCIWHGVKFVMSTLQYIIVLLETYKFQAIKYYRWQGVNKYMLYVHYILLHKSNYQFLAPKYICWHADSFQKGNYNEPIT